jgi:hypothetical protein
VLYKYFSENKKIVGVGSVFRVIAYAVMYGVSYSCTLSFSSPEQCAKHNAVRERVQKDFEIKTDFLKRHLKKLEEERTSEVQELSRSNEMRIRQVVR